MKENEYKTVHTKILDPLSREYDLILEEWMKQEWEKQKRPRPILPGSPQLPHPYFPPQPTQPDIDRVLRQQKIEQFAFKISHLLQWLPEDLSDRLMNGIDFLCKSFERIHAK